MFDYIHWELGKQPLMILNGKKLELDAVADTNLDGIAVKPHPEVIKVIVKLLDKDLHYATKFQISTPRPMTCWDFILTVNEYCNEIDLGGPLKVQNVIGKDDRLILECI